MTSRTGIPVNNPSQGGRGAFTLVELVLVMALLVTLAAVAVPALSRSLRGHNLDQDADRLLALTEYARDEAASQGIPMVVWIDVDGGRLGADAKPGFGGGAAGTENPRAREYTLADAHFDPIGPGMVSSVAPAATSGTSAQTPSAAGAGTHGGVIVAEFEPDGTLDPGSLPAVRIADRAGESLSVAQTADAYGYQIVRGGQ